MGQPNLKWVAVTFLVILMIAAWQSPSVWRWASASNNKLERLSATNWEKPMERRAQSQQMDGSKQRESSRFPNGVITHMQVNSNIPDDQALSRMSLSQLFRSYEAAAHEVTVDCSTTMLFGRAEGGGYDLCLVGPYVPQAPCFSFSFGINYIWGFDELVAGRYKCLVLAFDPSMGIDSQYINDRLVFIREGLDGSRRLLGDWPVDNFAGFLQRFGAEDFVIDILKVDVEGSEWPMLETAVRDNSLKNVKTLLLETHVRSDMSRENLTRFIRLFRQLHKLGFRMWKHNWANTRSNSKFRIPNDDIIIAGLQEHFFVNVNFLREGVRVRNDASAKIENPLALAASAHLGIPVKYNKDSSQEKALLSKSDNRISSANLSPSKLEKAVFTSLFRQRHLMCYDYRRIEKSDINGWNICFSHPFNISQSPSCKIFSIGDNGESGFEKSLAKKYKCKVYLSNSNASRIRVRQSGTSKWSQANSESASQSGSRSLCDFFKKLGDSNKVIDILKIDVNFSEWRAVKSLIGDNCVTKVKQIVLQTRITQKSETEYNLRDFWSTWNGLVRQGFRVWKQHSRPMTITFASPFTGAKLPCCHEASFVNINYL